MIMCVHGTGQGQLWAWKHLGSRTLGLFPILEDLYASELIIRVLRYRCSSGRLVQLHSALEALIEHELTES